MLKEAGVGNWIHGKVLSEAAHHSGPGLEPGEQGWPGLPYPLRKDNTTSTFTSSERPAEEDCDCSRAQPSKFPCKREGLETLWAGVLKDKNVLQQGDILPTTA